MSRRLGAEVILCIGLVTEAVLVFLPSRRRFWTRDNAGHAVFGACGMVAGLMLGSWTAAVIGLGLALVASRWARSAWRRGR